MLFHYNMPYVARSTGAVNCLACHEVPEGTVLGAISLTMDLTDQRTIAIRTVGAIVAVLFLVGLIMGVATDWLLKPVVKATNQLGRVVRKAVAGDFSARLDHQAKDEVGMIAGLTNQLLETLEHSIGRILHEVGALVKRKHLGEESNLLEHAVQVVHDMVRAAQFKQTVERP